MAPLLNWGIRIVKNAKNRTPNQKLSMYFPQNCYVKLPNASLFIILFLSLSMDFPFYLSLLNPHAPLLYILSFLCFFSWKHFWTPKSLLGLSQKQQILDLFWFFDLGFWCSFTMSAYSSWLDSVDTSLDLNIHPLKFSGQPPVSSGLLNLYLSLSVCLCAFNGLFLIWVFCFCRRRRIIWILRGRFLSKKRYSFQILVNQTFICFLNALNKWHSEWPNTGSHCPVSELGVEGEAPEFERLGAATSPTGVGGSAPQTYKI